MKAAIKQIIHFQRRIELSLLMDFVGFTERKFVKRNCQDRGQRRGRGTKNKSPLVQRAFEEIQISIAFGLTSDFTLVQSVLFNFHDQAGAGNSQLFCQFGFVPTCATKTFADHVSFQILQSIFEFSLQTSSLHF